MAEMTHNTQVLIATERERWLKLHLEGEITIVELSWKSGFSRDTLHRWKKAYQKDGLEGLKEKSRAHHNHPKTTPRLTTLRIRDLRGTTPCFGAKKIALRLKKEGVVIDWRTVHKVLAREGLVSKRRRLEKKTRWFPKATIPGEMIEVDVIYARKYKGNWLYQFTAVDSATRWKYSLVTGEQTNQTAVMFLRKLVEAAPFRIQGIKTDNGSIFTNYYTGYQRSAVPMNPRIHIFDKVCGGLGITHYLTDPGKPAQNGKVERSHRTDREEFWNQLQSSSLSTIKTRLVQYLKWYNEEREHLGIDGLTPVEKLQKCQI